MVTLSVLSASSATALVAWLYLLFLRGGFWRADQRLGAYPPPEAWPAVVAVVPARNEADYVGRAVASLLAQDYAGGLSVVLVDDGSDDGTADQARRAAAGDDRLVVVSGAALRDGWTGKLWAQAQGVETAAAVRPDATYLLLCDADIEHGLDALGRLVARAEAEHLDLVSLMVKLHCETRWERLLIPAFVFFFQQLYPFSRVNDPARTDAAAAGGCMLVRRQALDRIGGITAIRDRLIDDCALAAAIKQGGPIWLGLAERSRSLRPYAGLGDIWAMVARTAFIQLNRSALLVAAAAFAMVVIYLAPPVALLAGVAAAHVPSLALGGAGWLAMAVCYRPMLAEYGEPAWRAVALPAAALLYVAMMVDSARRGLFAGGAAWKQRTYSQ